MSPPPASEAAPSSSARMWSDGVRAAPAPAASAADSSPGCGQPRQRNAGLRESGSCVLSSSRRLDSTLAMSYSRRTLVFSLAGSFASSASVAPADAKLLGLCLSINGVVETACLHACRMLPEAEDAALADAGQRCRHTDALCAAVDMLCAEEL